MKRPRAFFKRGGTGGGKNTGGEGVEKQNQREGENIGEGSLNLV